MDEQARMLRFTVHGPIARGDLPGLAARVCGLLERSGATTAACDVASVDPDAVTVDALAKLQLAGQRHGCRVRLEHASTELVDLIDFMGLRDVFLGPEPVKDEPLTRRGAAEDRTRGTADRSKGRT